MTDSIPESRVYRHDKCSADTVISGQSFEVASNPLSDMTRTWCTTCNGFYPVSEYAWSDTGEKITDYYARHSANATPLQRFMCSKKFLIVCAVIGLALGSVAGFYLFRNQAQGIRIFLTLFSACVGVFVGAAANIELGKVIAKRVCGVSDTRILI